MVTKCLRGSNFREERVLGITVLEESSMVLRSASVESMPMSGQQKPMGKAGDKARIRCDLWGHIPITKICQPVLTSDISSPPNDAIII